MADYVSSLTGVAMDMALQDMAEHNSEAWAVGERNGIPVGSDDVTYQNNAQYYAQQAQSIAPASVTEAVRWDIAQTALTDANKAQARANIDAGKNGAWSNRNLLDNAYFVGGGSQLGDGIFPINQRGQASYSAYMNSIDRWYAAAAMTIAADGLSCGAIVQKLSQVAPLDGKTLTFSALLADGTMLSGSAVFNSASDTYFYFDAGASEYLLYNTYFAGFEVITPRKLAAVKLEYGTVSTLANDVPPNFQKELENCQHFLWVDTFGANTIISSGLTFNTSSVFDFIVPVPMRKTSIVATFTVTPYIVYGGNLALAGGATVTMSGHNGNHLRFQIGHQNNYDLGSLTHVDLLCGSETTVVVSAEL